jgi:hypothetical protein
MAVVVEVVVVAVVVIMAVVVIVVVVGFVTCSYTNPLSRVCLMICANPLLTIITPHLSPPPPPPPFLLPPPEEAAAAAEEEDATTASNNLNFSRTTTLVIVFWRKNGEKKWRCVNGCVGEVVANFECINYLLNETLPPEREQ